MHNRLFKSISGLALVASLVGCASTTTTPTTTTATTTAPTDATGQTTLRVASWNVDSKAHPDIMAMSDILHELGIEIMGFQEIDVNNTRNDYDMVQDFVNENYPYVHFAKGRDFANGGFGVGTTSSYPILEYSSLPIESTSSKATKALERVVFEKDGKTIAFYVTHTSWENTPLRRRQMAQIIERVKTDPCDYIIMVADWNADQSYYEYTGFLEDFNIANGLDGVFLDTFNGEDDSMKVMSVDNIITTKNMTISNVNTYHSDMADHDMIYADLTLLDEPKTFTANPNRALGQGVSATTTAADSDPFMAVDYDETTAWVADGSTKEDSVVLELAGLIKNGEISINYGTQPESVSVSVSQDGINYTPVDGDTTYIPDSSFKYVKFDLTSGESAVSINEIIVHGDYDLPSSVDTTDLVVDGTFDSDNAWSTAVSGEADSESETPQEPSTFENGLTNGEYVITRSNADGYGTFTLSQTIDVQPNTRYQLSFDQHSDTLDSEDFGYEIVQYDANGEVVPNFTATLSDNLNLSYDGPRTNDYVFTTSATTNSLEIRFNVSGGEGSLYLDNVHLVEAIQIDQVYLSGQTTLSIGETTQLTASYYPANYTDLSFDWVSLDDSIVSVDSDGNISANGVGSTYVGVQSDSDLIAESMILVTVTE